MSRPGLQALLEDGADVLYELVLPQLSVYALGRLATVSRGLRDFVAAAPESTWRSCAEASLRW